VRILSHNILNGNVHVVTEKGVVVLQLPDVLSLDFKVTKTDVLDVKDYLESLEIELGLTINNSVYDKLDTLFIKEPIEVKSQVSSIVFTEIGFIFIVDNGDGKLKLEFECSNGNYNYTSFEMTGSFLELSIEYKNNIITESLVNLENFVKNINY